MIKKCLICEKEFYAKPRMIKKGYAKYCSGKCYWKTLIGKSTWNKGKKLPQFFGKNNPFWKGGKQKTQKGYILIYFPNHPHPKNGIYIYEHRLVIEKQIGRYLLPIEEVHHLGKKDDNRLQMLMAFINSSVHKRFEHNPNNVKPEEIIFDGRKIKK